VFDSMIEEEEEVEQKSNKIELQGTLTGEAGLEVAYWP
jgi:hypothetical protein